MIEDSSSWRPAADVLRTLASLKGSIVLPSQEFFRPTEVFWSGLKSIVPPDVSLIDCGTGMGHVPRAAKQRNISMDGIDSNPRPGQDADTLLMDALQVTWNPKLWPLICRPNHGVWAHEVATNALKGGAGCLYAGLPKNMRRDLGKSARLLGRKVGEDGESLYFLCPAQSTVHMYKSTRTP